VPAPERISANRRISAPASRIFELITDPDGHVKIDGSGMLMAAPEAKRLRNVGDTFEMNMDREPLGDIPMGKYKVENTVTRIVEDAQLEWTVGVAGRGAFGHVYGYLLQPVGDGETEVTSYCDWSAVPDKWKGRVTWPVVPLTALVSSLEKLDQIITTPAQ
jgi:uncharacterized protein YndB with AHSA1/START domain